MVGAAEWGSGSGGGSSGGGVSGGGWSPVARVVVLSFFVFYLPHFSGFLLHSKAIFASSCVR